jgi:hypothetical protein
MAQRIQIPRLFFKRLVIADRSQYTRSRELEDSSFAPPTHWGRQRIPVATVVQVRVILDGLFGAPEGRHSAKGEITGFDASAGRVYSLAFGPGT